MVKKKSNGQNVVIIILCVLLLISIGFGVTYSYYNGNSNLVKGTITTANLSIELQGADAFGQTTEFSISAPFGEEFLVPGNNLNNVRLNLLNKCNQKTYMVVVYSLSAIKNDETKQDVTSQLTNMPAISFQEGKIDTDTWHTISYQCQNIDATYTCLVGIDPFEGRGDSDGVYINVLEPNSIKIPEQWNNILQGCSVTISVTAYAIQAENLGANYRDPIWNASDAGDIDAKAQAIAKAVLEICQVDVAASTETK
ncbi:MAG: hypothetical protein IJ371_04825 [Clostridia bacterium]|nr:hypothetical protein [Clostridia bacterium]